MDQESTEGINHNTDIKLLNNDHLESNVDIEHNLEHNIEGEDLACVVDAPVQNLNKSESMQALLNVDRRKIVITNGNLPEQFFEEAESDLHEKQQWIDRDIDALKDLVLAEPDLNSCLDRQFLLSFLRARKFDYEKAMRMMRGYYKSRQDNASVYENLLPSSLDHVWNKKMQTVLPLPDNLGRTVIIFRTSCWNPEECSMDDLFKSQVLILEHIVRLPITQLKGVTAVIDCSGLSMTHAYYITPAHVKRMVSLLQEVFPLRFKALHFVHEPSIFEWVFSLVKPFLSETLKGRLIFHAEDLKSLHNYVPADILPAELDGLQPPMDNKELVEFMKMEEEYFKKHFSYGFITNEAQPATTANDTNGSAQWFGSVSDVSSYVGSFYRRMCVE